MKNKECKCKECKQKREYEQYRISAMTIFIALFFLFVGIIASWNDLNEKNLKSFETLGRLEMFIVVGFGVIPTVLAFIGGYFFPHLKKKKKNK